jgi:serine protease Do
MRRNVMMRFLGILFLGTAVSATSLRAQSPRYVVDDDAYSGKVADACAKLHQAHKLVSLTALRREVHTKGLAMKLPPPSRQRFSPPDLCDRLRESTLAVGTYYKCPECGGWHFESSAGFVVADGGVVCTCCHVVAPEDPDVKESYLVAADAEGRVFPVESVLAADTDADTCFLQIDARGLKPLPLRPNVRAGEQVYCLSHPAGYFFMFTQGMVSRLNLRQDAAMDEHGQTNGVLNRPVLFLNVTAEFAPGSSGAPVTDDAGNVVGQVASIAEAGEPAEGDTNGPAAPSVPMRFCTAAEEILGLTDPHLEMKSNTPVSKPRKKIKSSGAQAAFKRRGQDEVPNKP